MATREEVNQAIKLFDKNSPQKVFRDFQRQEMGILGVLKYLDKVNGKSTSSEISHHLNISSARMVILLKKLDCKELIIRSKSIQDARVVDIELSEKGKLVTSQIGDHMYKAVEKVVDEYGLEELTELFMNLNKLKKIMNENLPNKIEGLND